MENVYCIIEIGISIGIGGHCIEMWIEEDYNNRMAADAKILFLGHCVCIVKWRMAGWVTGWLAGLAGLAGFAAHGDEAGRPATIHNIPVLYGPSTRAMK